MTYLYAMTSTKVFTRYYLHLSRRYPAYQVSARTSVLVKGDDLEQLLARAGRAVEQKNCPWNTVSIVTCEPDYRVLATFYLRD